MDDDQARDRRGDARRPIELKVEYSQLNTFFADFTTNISRGGTFIKSRRPLPVGTPITFLLYVPGQAEPLSLRGEVQRVVAEDEAAGGEAPGMGIRFVFDGDDGAARLERTVERLMTESLGPRLFARLMEQARQRRG